MFGAAAALVLGALLARGRAALLLVPAIAVYLTLFLADLTLAYLNPTGHADQRQYRYLYLPDERIGYRLRPGWKGSFDDGYAAGTIQINSLGARDDEPALSSARRVLLIGDSFTFGHALDQSATIDAQIEKSCGFDAYNLGVPGYGLPAIIETLRRNRLPAHHVFYLFFPNDLRLEDFQLASRYIERDGFFLPREDAFGKPFTEAEIDHQIAVAMRAPARLTRHVGLSTIRELIRAARQSRDVRADSDAQLLGAGSTYSDSLVATAVDSTLVLSRLSAERAASFTVVIIPSQMEIQAGHYAPVTNQYIDRIRDDGVAVIELFSQLDPSDYWLHDGHFNSRGAQRVARQLCNHLQSVLVKEGPTSVRPE